jgi:hypothetical protein
MKNGKEYLVSTFHKVSMTRFMVYSKEEKSNNTTYFGERNDTLIGFATPTVGLHVPWH